MPVPVATTRACTAKPRGVPTACWSARPSVGQRLAGGDAELRLDEIDARDLLGDGVLDLDARVALDEEVLAGLGDDQELDGAGVDVAGGAASGDGVGEDPLAQRRVEARRRARPRSPSGCGAAPSSRGRRGGRRCPGRRPRTCTSMWRGRATSRSTNSGAVAERGRAPRCGSARTPRPSRSGPVTARMPRPPPPADALSITG